MGGTPYVPVAASPLRRQLLQVGKAAQRTGSPLREIILLTNLKQQRMKRPCFLRGLGDLSA
jgi:hypothetical protein